MIALTLALAFTIALVAFLLLVDHRALRASGRTTLPDVRAGIVVSAGTLTSPVDGA